jgi:hypothetical protein
VDFDVTSIWWSGSGSAQAEPSAFQVQVGFGAEGENEHATQSTDPLTATNGVGVSLFSPVFSLPSAAPAQLGYTLDCQQGPFVSVYTTPFNDLAGWTVTGPVSINNGSPDNCSGFGGNNAHFNGDATITRTVPTVGFQSIRIDADYRGGAAYTLPTQCLQWWYSTNGGSNYTLYKSICGAAIPNGTWTCNDSFDFPAAAENNAGFRIRFQTTGGVNVRLDDLKVEGRRPPCNVTNDIRVELLSPGNDVFQIKAEGAPDPAKPVDVTAHYNGPDGGPGLWKIRLREFAGGTARMLGGSMTVSEASNYECDPSAACACPAAETGEVSDDPPHLLRLDRNGSFVDLLFEDLAAASYNVYVSTTASGGLLDVTGAEGKRSCGVAHAGAPGGMRLSSAYPVESGITTPSDIYYIVVTADNGPTTEGTLGYRSSGAERSATAYCAN